MFYSGFVLCNVAYKDVNCKTSNPQYNVLPWAKQ